VNNLQKSWVSNAHDFAPRLAKCLVAVQSHQHLFDQVSSKVIGRVDRDAALSRDLSVNTKLPDFVKFAQIAAKEVRRRSLLWSLFLLCMFLSFSSMSHNMHIPDTSSCRRYDTGASGCELVSYE